MVANSTRFQQMESPSFGGRDNVSGGITLMADFVGPGQIVAVD